MKRILTSLLVACTLLTGSVSLATAAPASERTASRAEANSRRANSYREVTPGQESHRETTTSLVAHAGQITKTQVESPGSNDVVKVTNRTSSPSDVDFVATDKEGNEVARETVVVDPKLTADITLQSLFPLLVFSDIGTIHIQASVRPVVSRDAVIKGRGGISVQAAQLAVAFFSGQPDPILPYGRR